MRDMQRANYRRTILAVLGLLAAGSCGPLLAQDAQTENDLLACDSIADQQERLECFNRVVESLREGGDMQAPSIEQPLSESVREPAAGEVATALPVPEAAPADIPAKLPEKRDLPATTESSESMAQQVASESPQSGRSDDDKEQANHHVILRSWSNVDGRFSVRLDNGEIWRETEGTRVGMPKAGSNAVITRSVFGSYRMKIEGINKTAWVRPAK